MKPIKIKCIENYFSLIASSCDMWMRWVRKFPFASEIPDLGKKITSEDVGSPYQTVDDGHGDGMG
jgi:hypothetical protein